VLRIINSKYWGTTLSVVTLSVLLMVSPCKLRNYIQLELGIPQTSVGNKSKSNASTTTCHAIQQDFVETTISTTDIGPSFIAANSTVRSGLIHTNTILGFSGDLWQVARVIPFYILYQNFKIYL